MARKGFCASCGREVWLGRDGGCQFGHPASQMSGVREADPRSAQAAAPAVRTTAPPSQPAAPAAQAAPPQPALAPRPFVPPPPLNAAPESLTSANVAAVPAPGAIGSAIPASPGATLPGEDAGWGGSPDDLIGSSYSAFDYTALPSDVSIGDTDCLSRRAVARLMDNFLLGALTLAILLPMLLASSSMSTEAQSAYSPMSLLVSIGLTGAYFVGLPLVWGGRTLGKAALGLAVTDMRGQVPSAGKLALRELAMIVDGLFSGIVGLVIASNSPRNQRIGDTWAETVVVRTR